MTEAEVDDLLGATLHGPLPVPTVLRLLATLDAWRPGRFLPGPASAAAGDAQREQQAAPSPARARAPREEWLATFRVALHGLLAGPYSGDCYDLAVEMTERLHGKLPSP